MRKEACGLQCSNSTPPALVGEIWRGVEIQHGYKVGEWDYKFDTTTVKIKDPKGVVTTGTVAQANGIIEITTADGKKYNLQQFQMNDFDETNTIVFGMGAANTGEYPLDLRDAMTVAGNRAVLLNRCKPEKKLCDFTPVFATAQRRLRGVFDTITDLSAAFLKDVVGNTDACNQFTNIADCVDPTKWPKGVSCGFCIGAAVKYQDPTMPTNAHCAGFDESGKPLKCICPTPGIWCQGEECAKGWNCIGAVGTATAKCVNNTKPPFSYRSKQECIDGAGSLPACLKEQLVLCNEKTKKCDIDCTTGTPGCNTKDYCKATCNLPHAKCNRKTKQCVSCDPGTDPACLLTKGACDTECSKNYNKCNLDTGMCKSCEPEGDPTCTVNGCDDAACKKHQKKYECDHSQPLFPVCKVATTGGTSLTDCNKNCSKPPPTYYYCDIQNPAGPKCINGTGPNFHPNKTTGYCGTTAQCEPPKLARCDTKTGKCLPCTIGSPGCMVAANCKIGCKPTGNLNGTYRAIEISKQFTRGEFDFTFNSDDTLDMAFHPADDVSVGPKWELTEGTTVPIEGLGDTPGAMISFTVKKVAAGDKLVEDELKAAGFSLKVGDKLKGVYVTKTGQNGVAAFMYMALSLPNAAAATGFDDGMLKIEFNMVSCKETGTCDFSSSSVAPLALADSLIASE
jgi:hypothetical protein